MDLKATEYEIGELRPGAFDTQIITIKVKKVATEQLFQERILKVGMVNCRIDKHINMSRCYKYWSYGHRIPECNGPNRSILCFKCGGEGHTGHGLNNEK